MDERDAIVAWLRSFDIVEKCIANGDYIRFSTAHGEDRDRYGYYSEAADAIERGDHLPPPPLAVSDDKDSSHD